MHSLMDIFAIKMHEPRIVREGTSRSGHNLPFSQTMANKVDEDVVVKAHFKAVKTSNINLEWWKGASYEEGGLYALVKIDTECTYT